MHLLRIARAVPNGEHMAMRQLSMNFALRNGYPSDLTFPHSGEREELTLTANRLMGRTLTVHVSVDTVRNPQQQDAMQKVMALIDEIAAKLLNDMESARKRLMALHAACVSDATVAADQKFQAMVISCALEDQKNIKKRLESLIRNIDNSEKTIKIMDNQKVEDADNAQANGK